MEQDPGVDKTEESCRFDGHEQVSPGHLHLDGFDSLLLRSKIKRHPLGTCHEGRIRESIKQRRHARRAGHEQVSPGHLHLDGFDSLLLYSKKNDHP